MTVKKKMEKKKGKKDAKHLMYERKTYLYVIKILIVSLIEKIIIWNASIKA